MAASAQLRVKINTKNMFCHEKEGLFMSEIMDFITNTTITEEQLNLSYLDNSFLSSDKFFLPKAQMYSFMEDMALELNPTFSFIKPDLYKVDFAIEYEGSVMLKNYALINERTMKIILLESIGSDKNYIYDSPNFKKLIELVFEESFRDLVIVYKDTLYNCFAVEMDEAHQNPVVAFLELYINHNNKLKFESQVALNLDLRSKKTIVFIPERNFFFEYNERNEVFTADDEFHLMRFYEQFNHLTTYDLQSEYIRQHLSVYLNEKVRLSNIQAKFGNITFD